MRVILWLVGLGALVWCGYWVLASRAAERGAIAALDDLRLHGQADYEALSASAPETISVSSWVMSP